MLKKIKKFFSFNKNHIPIKSILGDQPTLSAISDSSFLHPEKLNAIERDLVILIVSNNFMVEYSTILAYFSRNYDFSVNEFVILSFKIGMLARTYVDNSILLLEHAIKIKDAFTDEYIDVLKGYLEKQIVLDDDKYEREHIEYQLKLDKDKKESKLGAEDKEANALIDEWLAKNKKES